MKISNLFKKLNSKVITTEVKNIQPLDRNQLEKVIGGTSINKATMPIGAGISGTTSN